MPHLSYKEFKNRFGDLGITKYTKAMWLEEGCEEIGVLKCSIFGFETSAGDWLRYSKVCPTDMDYTPGGRLTKGLYLQNFTLMYNGEGIESRTPMQIYVVNGIIYIELPEGLNQAQCQAYLKDKVILYKKKITTVINPAIKIEGELGRYLNAQGEWTTGALGLGAFKYEVTGGHTYDVVNAKAASSSYIMFLDSNGNRIGNVIAMTSANYPKVGDTRPMQMPANCKYVWLVMASTNLNLPIPLLN